MNIYADIYVRVFLWILLHRCVRVYDFMCMHQSMCYQVVKLIRQILLISNIEHTWRINKTSQVVSTSLPLHLSQPLCFPATSSGLNCRRTRCGVERTNKIEKHSEFESDQNNSLHKRRC